MWAAGPCEQSHSSPAALSPQCREALTTRQKLIAQDYKVSYSLAKSCKSDLKKYRCNVENLPRSREARLSYLLMCLESAVHRGESSFLFIFSTRFWIFAPVLALLSIPVPVTQRVFLRKQNSRLRAWRPSVLLQAFPLNGLKFCFSLRPSFFFFLRFISQIQILIFKMPVAQQF